MFTLNCKGRLLIIDEPVVMGIINTTPDSFYEGSRKNIIDDILYNAEKHIKEGATIIDIGGQSTRPGSKLIDANEELRRVLPAIEAVNKNFPETYISIDTYYSTVAKKAVESGACIVNDVGAGELDKDLIATVSSLGVPYVLMHMQGAPQNMQDDPFYKNVTLDVFDFLNIKINELTIAGIKDIIIDPGFGFGKTIAHNFKLLQQLEFLKKLNKPLMVGLSRKGTIYKTLGVTANEALNGTTVLHTLAIQNGASILRVHDVKEARETIQLYQEYSK